ncbi:MAG TPA: HlyD family efflux transporter periplasmic adaptor subunit [Candidatus Acidoferrum sp.]|nr:HlyD family efflux transporter periplasmic adaptor subunit [Candidatus Acidoferrum sp.]
MDVPRPFAAQARRRRQIVYAVAGMALIASITMGVSKLKPAAPSVDRLGLWIDTVKRGPMVRQVRGLGTLTPEEIRWIPTITDGRVEKILVRPGTPVKANTVVVILSNPTVEQQTFDAEWKLRAEEAQYHNLEVTLQSQVLDQKANTAKAEQDAEDARMKADTDEQLAKQGVIAKQASKLSTGSSRQLSIRAEIEQQRYENAQKALEAQLAAERAKVEQARAMYALQQKQKNMLQVTAGVDGILQELTLNGNTLQEGQQVPAGTTIAKVANPNRLKAELKIPETEAKDVQLGQPAQVDSHNGVIEGKVIRIDPSVQNGTRTVDVALIGELPPGAVPDLSVDGTIDLERLANVLLVGRPVSGQEKSTVGMFKLQSDGRTASRVQVTLGRSSVNTVEILDGLKDGEQVILSDMSRWDQYERIRLN